MLRELLLRRVLCLFPFPLDRAFYARQSPIQRKSQHLGLRGAISDLRLDTLDRLSKPRIWPRACPTVRSEHTRHGRDRRVAPEPGQGSVLSSGWGSKRPHDPGHGAPTLARTRVPALRHVRDAAVQAQAHASCTDTCTAAIRVPLEVGFLTVALLAARSSHTGVDVTGSFMAPCPWRCPSVGLFTLEATHRLSYFHTL